MITRITLNGDTPSKKNSKRVFCQGKRPVVLPSEKHQEWHEEQMWALKTVQKPKNAPLSDFCSITLTFYPSTLRKADLSNKAESVMDLLVDAGFLEDDNWFVVGELILRFGEKDKENPRAEVIIDHG